jgi:signal transduction histidine kinase
VKPLAYDDISRHPELIGKMDEMIPLHVSLGIGLPMARVYANYWGGSLSLYSMNGYGTDVYITISTANSFENLNFEE